MLNRFFSGVCLLLILFSPSFAEELLVTEIEQSRDRGFDYLDIYTNGWIAAKGIMLEDKLYIDLPNCQVKKGLTIAKTKSRRIKSIKVAPKDKDSTRIIITLKKDVDYEIVNVFGRNKTVVEICDRLADLYAQKFAWEERCYKTKAQPLKPTKLSPLTSPDRSLAGKIIILDPGHGGDDPGAFSCSGLAEKNLTLQTAQLTAKLLREAGAEVYLTRNEDRRGDLGAICDFVNKTRGDIFISIHYNSIFSPKICGSETYYYNPMSRRFAEKMHEAIIREVGRKDHGLRRTPFYVVKNSAIPSVLLEPAYLTNPEENSLISSAAFQENLSQAIVAGVKAYFRN